jgi:hypothetical protein
VVAAHDLDRSVGTLVAFLRDVHARRAELQAEIPDPAATEGTLLASFREEVRWTARDLGLDGAPPEIDGLLETLAGGPAPRAL